MLDASWRVSGQGRGNATCACSQGCYDCVSQGRADPQLQMLLRQGPKLATESPLIVEGMRRQVPETFGFRHMK